MENYVNICVMPNGQLKKIKETKIHTFKVYSSFLVSEEPTQDYIIWWIGIRLDPWTHTRNFKAKFSRSRRMDCAIPKSSHSSIKAIFSILVEI